MIVNLDALHETKKSEMEKLLKMRIGGLMRREAEKKMATMKKLRFWKGSEFGKKEYMKHCDAEEIARILKVKLTCATLVQILGNQSRAECANRKWKQLSIFLNVRR